MIRLHSLTITHFRGIQEGKLEGLIDVNLLIGRNNSGKTTVIEAINRLATAAGLKRDCLDREVKTIWSRDHEATEQPRTLWYRQDKSRDIEFKGVYGDTLMPEVPSELIQRIPERRSYHAERAITLDDESPQESPAAKNRAPHFFASMTVLRPVDGFNAAIEQQLWPQLLSNRRDKFLTNTLNQVFGLNAESFQLLPNNELMVLFDDYGLPLDSQGDGTRAAMRTMMVLSMLKSTLLLLEEPECHQHPGSLERFAKALCGLARQNEVQVVISTHSAECVRAFLKAAREVESEAAVFHLKLENGKQDARRLDPGAVETLESSGVDVRFLDLYG